jgi:hypothetical protein
MMALSLPPGIQENHMKLCKGTHEEVKFGRLLWGIAGKFQGSTQKERIPKLGDSL